MTTFTTRFTIFALGFGLLSATPLFAEYESIWEENEYNSLRFDLPFDYEGNADGDSELSFQAGVGVGLSAIDEMGLLVGHADADAGNRTYVAFWAEENYTPIGSVIPFAGVNVGWGEYTGADGAESLYGKIELGGKYFLCPQCAVTGSLSYSWSLENIYLTDDGADDKNFEVGVGLRWYY